MGLWRRLDHAGVRHANWSHWRRDLLGKLHAPFAHAHVCAGYSDLLRPTADDRETWLPTLRHIALEGRCFVLGCNQFVRRSDYPADYPIANGDNSEAILSRGGSCIIDPLGRVVAGPDFDGPNILSATLDLDEVARGKFDFDVAGHYARPDVFQLTVDTRPKDPVVWRRDEPSSQKPDGH